jgi:ribonuclease HI
MNGCRWVIGSGTKIKVMSDPWVRDDDGAWLPSPQSQGVHNMYVNELLLQNEKKWDKEKIQSLFHSNVVNRILDIPLFSHIEEDKLIWKDSMHGEYSVKSGYNMLLDVIGQGLHHVRQERWNHIWKIKAPPKAKHLLWRICRDCVPTRFRLRGRCVPCPLTCPICEQHDEDDWHIFFSCHDSLLALQTAGLDHVITSRAARCQTAAEMVFSICAEEETGIAGGVALILWAVWRNRNEKVWNGATDSGRSIGITAMQQWQQWSSVQHQHASVQQQQHTLTWQKPPMNWFKCNVDAGFNMVQNRATVGWCVRDHGGNFNMAGTLWQEGKFTVLEGEANALLEALKVLQQKGYSHVIFETDCKGVVDAIHNIHGGVSEFSSIICKIKSILLVNPNFVVKFVKRQANMVAHTLAKAASSWARCCTFEHLPLCITAYLNNEMQ